jgi:methylated-DNA-[protein]-cysteine S-methyltransferase
MDVEVVAYDVDGWGVGELWLDGATVVNHELPTAGGRGKRRAHPLAARLGAYFRGKRDDFADADLDLAWCTPFQGAVAAALRAVPYGETVTYGELAALAGFPNAHRAVGSFCARNRFPLFLPCHRVVAAAGAGPYGSLGTPYKRRMLALEGVVL